MEIQIDTKINKKRSSLSSILADSNFINDLKKNYNLYIMIMPATIAVILFCYLPMYGLIIAFKDYDIILGIKDSPWVGFKQYISFLNDPYALRIITNTFLLGFYNLLWGFWPPILFAILLSEIKQDKFKNIVQSMSLFPYFIAIVVIVGLMLELLSPSGVVNKILNSYNIETVAFLNKPSLFRTLYISSGIWQTLGYTSIIYLAALSGVSQELYEAAYIDGANRFQLVLYISLPSIMPTVSIMLILSSANIINVGFEKVYLMYSPAVYETADVISTYVYRRGISSMNFSYGTAVGLLNSFISLAIISFTNYFSRKVSGNSLY